MAEGLHETFDVTKAMAAIKSERLEGLSLVIIPYSLLTVRGKSTAILNNHEQLKADGMEVFEDGSQITRGHASYP
jgi:hypothetical protein